MSSTCRDAEQGIPAIDPAAVSVQHCRHLLKTALSTLTVHVLLAGALYTVVSADLYLV
jgi:hypothetical protein